MEGDLFRREAVERQGERLWGELVLDRSPLLALSALLLTVFIAAALAFLAAGDYNRRQQVSGYLVPDRGLMEVAPPRAGLLLTLAVSQGDRVENGALLFEVQADRRSGGELPVSEAQLVQLAGQERALDERLGLERRALELLHTAHEGERRRLEEELAGLARLLAVESELALLRERAYARAARLGERGLLARTDLDAVRAGRLEQERAVEGLRLRRRDVEAAQAAGVLEYERARLAARRNILDLEARRAELRKQGAALEADSRNKVFAPVAGRVAFLAASPGQLVGPERPLLALVPDGSHLEAELLVPSGAIAFLAPGQVVNLRYEAFPYQKFGVQQAVLREVADSALDAGGEGLYRARASLAAQHVPAYGREVPLRPGMRLRADIVVERRSLLQWLLDPLFSLRGIL